MPHQIQHAILLIACLFLSGCVAYPAYYPAPAVAPSQGQAQAAANEQCAKIGDGT